MNDDSWFIVFWFILGLALNVAAIIVAIHFIAKFW